MRKRYEVGEIVTVTDDNYMKEAQGVILDVSSSSGGVATMYTVDVEKHGTHYFYGWHIESSEKDSDVYKLSA